MCISVLIHNGFETFWRKNSYFLINIYTEKDTYTHREMYKHTHRLSDFIFPITNQAA